MGNTQSEQLESSDAASTIDVERGGNFQPRLSDNLDAHLECPEEAFVRIGLAGPAHRRPAPGAEKKRTTLGSSLKRLLSGKARRKMPPPLPMTSDDASHRSADSLATPEPAGGPPALPGR